MSVVTADTQALARAAQSIIKGVGSQFAGKQRGRDWAAEGRRVPRKNSYEVNDPRSNKWVRIGDGSFAQGTVYVEALLKTANELYLKGWAKFTNRMVRDAREQYNVQQQELEALEKQPNPPAGRIWALKREVNYLADILEAAKLRLRRIDLDVLSAILGKLNYRTGECYPAIDRIAEDAGCHRNSVNAALRRLKHHGLISWVRRTVRTSNEGEFAPQLEQTSNAYHFEHQQKMESGVWQRYKQLLVAKLRRLGAAAVKALAPAPAAPREASGPKDPELAATLNRMAASFPNANT